MKPRRLLNDSGLFGMIIALLGLAQPAQATLRAWSGAVSFDNTWTNAGNWSGNVAPVAGDDLEFPDSALHPNNTDNFAAGTTFNSITFFHGGSGGMSHGYDISGNAIALNAGISVVNNSVSSWPITLNNALMLNSNQTFATGPFTSLSLLGPINLNGNDLTFDTASFSPAGVEAVSSGAGEVIKTNSGVLTLWSNNTYTGSTTLSGGLFQILGSQPTSPILLTLGTLHASSAVGTITSIGSSGPGSIVLSPGGNAGSLTCSNVALNSSTTFVADLNGTTPGASYDQLNVNGTVVLNNATLTVTLGYTPAVGGSNIQP